MPFTPIEEQHYQELFNQMCEDVGLDAQGAPLLDTWNPDEVSDIMRRWLVRLRQTVLHPEVGGRNRRALGQKDGPLRTVDQVLDVMMDQTDFSIRSDQRALLASRLRRGQLFENSPRVREALDIWEEVVTEIRAIVEECRAQLLEEQAKVTVDAKSLCIRSQQVSGVDSDGEDQEE
jgi:E3 ubiquitin-protein ligase SHPRH